MVYRGSSKEKINFAVTQATCWTFFGDWEDLPNKGEHFCDLESKDYSQNILEDDYTITGENWSCYVRAYDGSDYSSYLMSNNLIF